MRVLRLVSTLFGVGAILLAWHSSKLLFPRQPALRVLLVAFVALIPQFVYINSVINNNSPLIFLVTATLYVLLKADRAGMTLRRSLVLGLLCGLILLTKLTGLFFGLTVVVAFLLHRSWWRYLPACALAVVLVAGWWYGRNLLIYDDLLLTKAFEITWANAIIPTHTPADTLKLVLERMPYSYATTWARFGGGAVAVTPIVSTLRDILMIGGILGVIVAFGRRLDVMRQWKQWIVLIVGALVWVVALIYLSSQSWSGVQGRYVLPGISAWAALLAAGWSAWSPRRWRPALVGVIVVALGVGLVVSAVDFTLAYRVLPAAAGELSLNYRYEDAAELISASPARIDAEPGDVITLTLEWRALSTPQRALKTFIHSLRLDGQPVADAVNRDSYPGTGNLPVADWQAGMTWNEQYVIRVADTAARQQVIQLVVGLDDAETLNSLEVTNAEGTPITATTTTLVLHDPPSAAPEVTEARFGDQIGLSGVTITDGGGRNQRLHGVGRAGSRTN